MRRALLPASILILLSASCLSAQETPRRKPKIKWIPDLARAKTEAPRHDVPVFVYVYLSNDPGCLSFEEKVFAESRFARMTRFFLMVRVDARRHAEALKEYDVKRYPALLYMDSSADVLYKLDKDLTSKRVLHYMGRTFLVSMYNSGMLAKEKGHVRKAMRRFQTLLAISRGTPAHNWARREIRRIAADAVKKLSQSKIALDKDDYVAAMQLLDQLVYEYRGTESYEEAKALYEKLAADERAVAALRQVIAEARAERMLQRALKLEQKKKLEDALILYWDITRNVPGTPAEKRAAERATALVADRKLALRAARIRMNRDCRQWLEMGWNFEKNNQRAKALEYYHKVIEYYAGTSYARKAQQAIDKLMQPQ